MPLQCMPGKIKGELRCFGYIKPKHGAKLCRHRPRHRKLNRQAKDMFEEKIFLLNKLIAPKVVFL
jgi:hypothetical protein